MRTITEDMVQEFLEKQYILHLGTVSQDKIPHVNVLLFTVDDDMNFYVATHDDSHKVKNLAENNDVSIVIWEHKDMLLQVQAKAEVVAKEKMEWVLDKLGEASSKAEEFWPPIMRISGENYIAYKCVPSRITALDLKSNTLDEEQDPFFTIKE